MVGHDTRIGAYRPAPAFFLVCALLACSPATDSPGGNPSVMTWKCGVVPDSVHDSSPFIGCLDDYRALAAPPLNTSIPGALSVKTVIDRADGGKLYFLDTRKYSVHYLFAQEHLSGNGKPTVATIAEFGRTEYYSPDRRFILGSLTYYEGPGIWAWEVMPSDNAGAEMIALALRKVADACFCGKDLYFHATSVAIEEEAGRLPATVKVLTTDGLYERFAYQPLNYATGIGRLVFTNAAGLDRGYGGNGDIVVLDSAPDDLPSVAGVITQRFQPPLARINVLARERGIPNLGLKGALSDSTLRALEGGWVRLAVDAFGYSVMEATREEADAWQAAHKPSAVTVPELDTAVIALLDVERILDPDIGDRGQALKAAVSAFGGTTGHLSALSGMDSGAVRYEKSFGIPVFYYVQHMRKNGLDDSVGRMLADPAFMTDPEERERRLGSLREAIVSAPLDSGFREMLDEKLDGKFPGIDAIRFVSSSNAEGLDGFTGIGVRNARIGGRGGVPEGVKEALLGIWASVWGFGAFEERRIRNIDHKAVGMGVLVQAERNGTLAEGSGVTANPFDPLGYEPGFFINAGPGRAAASDPRTPAGSDQFIYLYTYIGQPIVMLARSGGSSTASTVLTRAQTYALGIALWEIHEYFRPVYGRNPAEPYAMGADFRLAPLAGAPAGSDPVVILDGVRPYRGWGKW